MIRHYTFIDQCLMQLEQALRTPHATERTYPAADVEQPALSVPESRHAAGLMRVNHTGEICAQALYQGQALTAREPQIRETMQTAAAEEIDHLNWCRQRLTELNSHTSYLNPLWYIGSLAMGIAAGIAGDKWSLGFLAETERQVSQHLQGHLEKLPAADQRSRAIVEQMNIDEQQHAHTAIEAGAAELPALIKIAMKGLSKVMTMIAYRI